MWDVATLREAVDRGDLAEGALACAYVASRMRLRAGARFVQGRRRDPLTSRTDAAPVTLFAQHRVFCISEPVAQALVAWANHARDVELRRDVPTARQLVSLQARGRRCVSLLGPIIADTPDDHGLEFALHDLCHLEKFVDPEHHRGQRGFFAAVDAALDHPAWRLLDARLDEEFRAAVERVVADMNGSAIFLFAALKMKLRMASRRRFARDRGVPPRTEGPLDDGELALFHEDLALLLEALALEGEVGAAAGTISTKRDAKQDALVLLAHFEARAR